MFNDSGGVNLDRPFPGHEPIFAKILSISKKYLLIALQKSLADSDRYLYDICQQDQATIGSPNIENLKILRFFLHSIEFKFLAAIDARFAKFKHLQSQYTEKSVDFSLVELEDTDDVVSAELLSESLTRNYNNLVQITAQRLCALLGFNQTELAKTPLTEKHIAEYLLFAFQGVEIPPKIRLIIFRYYEHAVIELFGSLLEDVNKPMVDAGVLLNLDALKLNQKRKVAREDEVVHSDRPATPQASSDLNLNTLRNPGMQSMQAVGAESALFEEICRYLHALRPQASSVQEAQINRSNNNYGVGLDQQTLSTKEMLSVLSVLQNTVPDSIVAALKSPEASIAKMLKKEMLESAPINSANNSHFEIAPENEDALDLVGMLFDVLMSERDFREEAKTLISRMVIPYTKAAILDRRLFLTKAHPARKLLNSITEAVEGNYGDGPQERDLLKKAENTVDQLVSGFNEDIAIFEFLEQELRNYLDQHRRRVDLAEKRAKEAQRGQDRLENARSLAAKELSELTHNAELPAVIKDFFSRYWTHHLSMVALREGEESHSWNAAVKLADDMVNILNNEPIDMRAASIMKLGPHIESVLSSSGVLPESSLALVHKIAESAKFFEVGQQVLQKAPAQKSSLSESSLHLAFNKDSLDYNQADADFFKTLVIGAWLQLEGSGGNFSPVKLAWISPISSRLMFVNRRGVRVLVVSVEELAQMKKQGKLIIHAQDNVFEQTMDRMLSRLKSDFA